MTLLLMNANKKYKDWPKELHEHCPFLSYREIAKLKVGDLVQVEGNFENAFEKFWVEIVEVKVKRQWFECDPCNKKNLLKLTGTITVGGHHIIQSIGAFIPMLQEKNTCPTPY